MTKVYLFQEEPSEGYYKLIGPQLIDNMRKHLQLISLEGKLVDNSNDYKVSPYSKLDSEKIKFMDQEIEIIRPRIGELYLDSPRPGELPSLFQGPIQGSPKFDPKSSFPNRWEMEELIRKINSKGYDVATLKLSTHLFIDVTKSENLNIALANIGYFNLRK